jgi:hypothetical protein
LPKRYFFALSLAIGLAVPLRARAQSLETPPAQPPTDPPSSFGSGGQFVLSVDRLAGVNVNVLQSNGNYGDSGTDHCSHTGVSASFFGSSGWGVGDCASGGLGPIQWGADVFVARGISVGGSLGFSYDSTDHDTEYRTEGPMLRRLATSSHAFTFSPRVGFASGLGKNWAFWPRVGIEWVEAKSDVELLDPNPPQDLHAKTRWHLVSGTLEAKFVFSPIAHVAFFGGPFAKLPISMKTDQENLVAPSWELRTKAYEFGATAGVLLYL